MGVQGKTEDVKTYSRQNSSNFAIAQIKLIMDICDVLNQFFLYFTFFKFEFVSWKEICQNYSFFHLCQVFKSSMQIDESVSQDRGQRIIFCSKLKMLRLFFLYAVIGIIDYIQVCNLYLLFIIFFFCLDRARNRDGRRRQGQVRQQRRQGRENYKRGDPRCDQTDYSQCHLPPATGLPLLFRHPYLHK